MFNAPRRTGGSALAQSAFINSSHSGAYVDPLASSTPNPPSSYGDVDPWSAAPSPARGGTPRADSDGSDDGRVPAPAAPSGRDALSALMADPPPLYLSLHDQLEPSMSDNISLASTHRLLSTSKLPAATIEKILNLTCRDKTSLSRVEFFCALALVALAQSSPESDPDVSIERLSASVPNLPLPSLSSPPTRGYVTSPSTEAAASPWETGPRVNGRAHTNGTVGLGAEAEAERGYWKRLETVDVELVAEKEGWFLQKYKVESDKRGAVSRRYSDFVWLLDCLVRRYPFRILPSLPPKRIGPLRRFINMVVNHPVMKDDGALNVFLTEPNFEVWRKRTKVSTDEESASKRLNPAQEMGIPADLEEKLGLLRDHLPSLLASYQKLVVLAERSLGRLQAASADASRFALSLHTVEEEMPSCCHRGAPGGAACTLCLGVGRGLGEVGEGWTRVAEEGEKRAAIILSRSIEALKTQRDLYLAFRDLFVRHDRLSKDAVDSLRKKVETKQKKIESLRAAAKPGWEVEADKFVAAIDQDNSTINASLSRRVFIRACMWHELAVVFHSRQAAQATLGWREFARSEGEAARAVAAVWDALGERLASMPVE